jgi:hypothetical protein
MVKVVSEEIDRWQVRIRQWGKDAITFFVKNEENRYKIQTITMEERNWAQGKKLIDLKVEKAGRCFRYLVD